MPVGLHSEAFAAVSPAIGDPRLAAEIDDVFLPADRRLDDRTRASIAQLLADVVEAIESDIRRHAARALAAGGEDRTASSLLGRATAFGRLRDAGVLRDPALMAEVIAQVRCVSLAEALPVSVEAGEGPGLLLRLIDLPDRVVAAAARALLAADSDRPGMRGALPADLHHRLVWMVAAAIRDELDGGAERALADAAQRCLVVYDESERPAALAARLVAAIDPLPAEVPALLVGALSDRRPLLFVATLSRALAIPFEDARALMLDPAGDRLWPALRAAGLERADIARIALALADADPRRDIEAFADRLDAIAAIEPVAARAAVAPLALPVEFRRAIGVLAARR